MASPLALALGKDIGGKSVVADLQRMPHLLIAGTTGSGKSVGINAMVLSLLYKSTPEHVRMIMIDPKMLELSVYEGIPHLLAPVVTDMKQAANALRWCVAEMERRYQLMAALGVRNIGGYNRKVREAIDEGQADSRPAVRSARQRCRRSAEAAGAAAAAVHRRRHRRAGRHDDDRRQEGRRADCAPGAEGARLGHPPDPRHAAAVGGRDHRADQGQHSRRALPSRCRPRWIRAPSSTRVAPRAAGPRRHAVSCRPAPRMPMRVHGAFVSDQEVHRVVARLRGTGARRTTSTRSLDGPSNADSRVSRASPLASGGDGGDRSRIRSTTRPCKIVTETASLDLRRPAPAQDRLQPRRADGRDDGSRGHGRAAAVQRLPRSARAAPPED